MLKSVVDIINMAPITVSDICNHLRACIFEEGVLKQKGEMLIVPMLFSMLTKNSDRVEFAMHLLEKYDLLPVPDKKLLKQKSLEKSLELRNLGNKAFMKKDHKQALLLYTKSIATAPFPANQELPKDGDHVGALAIALANRSAVLFSMGKHELCLRDISQAMKYCYPNKLLYKIFERQGKCLQSLGRKREAIESINNALKWLPSARDLASIKKQEVKIELEKHLKSIQSAKPSVKHPYRELAQLPICSYGKNHEIPCASDCVELKYCPEMGRYISATRDIKPGDVLIVEKPFASYLFFDKFETHCYNCLQHSEALLPCYFCSNVMYCSEDCRSSSWSRSHFTDCPLLPILQKLEIPTLYILVLKIVIIVYKTMDFRKILTSLEAEKNHEKRSRGFNNEGQYSSSDYGPIYWLEGNTEKRDPANLYTLSLVAACILHCLETMTDFFSDVDVNQFKYEVGGLLLHHMQNLNCNSEEIGETVAINVQRASDLKVVGIGAAAYAFMSLLNHSCDPNVIRTCHAGDIGVIRAIHPIAAGDQVIQKLKIGNLVKVEIFDCYGLLFTTHGKTERKTYFESNYYFTCGCIACVEDWPIHDLLPFTEPTFICTRCKHVLPTCVADLKANRIVTCANCNKTHNLSITVAKLCMSLTNYIHNFKQFLARREGTDWVELAHKMSSHLLLLHENIKRPWKEHENCMDIIKQCYRMTGNVRKE